MKVSKVDFNRLSDPGNKYQLEECLSRGVFGRIYKGRDKQTSKCVAVKIQKLVADTKVYVEKEYTILKDFTDHMNLVDFYGCYRKNDEVWLVLELCDGGPIIDVVNELIGRNRRLSEEHIAHVLKETVKALIYLHQNKIIHRDVKAKNILLTKDGEVKLTDFGLCHTLKSTLDKTGTSLGSPCWMAPEVVTATEENQYGSRVDVWALGITAIELGDGKAPMQDVHPTRVLFQVVRNPPPTLYRPSNWTQNYNDFINECLIKNQEYRPYMEELIEHPFLDQIPSNNFHLSLELKSIITELATTPRICKENQEDYHVFQNKLVTNINEMEDLLVEDLAALERITENTILEVLEARAKKQQFHTFIGDVLLVLNGNEPEIYGEKYHRKYSIKSRSENAPHIYAIADTAYQNAQHHTIQQNIVLTGESASGKTKNYLHLVDHLIFLGENDNVNTTRITEAIKLIHALTHATTAYNNYSTRCVMKTEFAFGASGKITGASFAIEALEKWRVSSVDETQGNFHMLYYIFHGLKREGKLNMYNLDSNTIYRYLRQDTDVDVKKFKKILTYLDNFDFSSEEIETILAIVCAVIILGNVRFEQTEDNVAALEEQDCVKKVSDLLKIDEKKFAWSLTNYCLQRNKSVVRRRNTSDEGRDSRDVLANTLYQRLVDYIVGVINQKLEMGKAIFGEKYTIKLLDCFGFECFKQNGLEELFINCLNEQFQYHYLQRLFAWEAMDVLDEDIDYQCVNFYNNKTTLDELLKKPTGIFTSIDQVSKIGGGGKYIIDFIDKQNYATIQIRNNYEFSICHYTGRVTYNSKEIPAKNREFLPPEITETMRLSKNPIVRRLFSNKLTKTGNLLIVTDSEKQKDKKENDYSQIRRMRTASTIFRSISLNLIRDLSSNAGTHFVRCVRTNIGGKSSFHHEIVRQQIRAMAVVETAKAKQCGYTCRMSFSEFLRRYKFLAFDFDETVEITRENCRLLLIRLNMEGFAIGKTKVFLKYYNEEYLSRLYENQVRKIVKIQSILRGFLVKCRLSKQQKTQETKTVYSAARRMSQMTEEEAAAIIQHAYRKVRGQTEQSQEYDSLNNETINFIKPYALKWKNNSLFHVLMQYRAARIHDLFNFAQQVHLFNLQACNFCYKIDKRVDVEELDFSANVSDWIGEFKPKVLKLNFRLNDLAFYDTSVMIDELTNSGVSGEKEESWDTPYRNIELMRNKSEEKQRAILTKQSSVNSENLINMTYSRDPEDVIESLPEYVEEPEEVYTGNTKKEESSLKQKQENVEALNKVNLRKIGDLSRSEPANKDFDYIKATPKPAMRADPISELKGFGRRSSTSSDDPPFNFQGMLRKTNYKRDSIKEKVVESVRRFSLKKSDPVFVNNNGVKDDMEFKHVSEELAPGLFIEGFEIAL